MLKITIRGGRDSEPKKCRKPKIKITIFRFENRLRRGCDFGFFKPFVGNSPAILSTALFFIAIVVNGHFTLFLEFLSRGRLLSRYRPNRWIDFSGCNEIQGCYALPVHPRVTDVFLTCARNFLSVGQPEISWCRIENFETSAGGEQLSHKNRVWWAFLVDTKKTFTETDRTTTLSLTSYETVNF